MASSLILGCLSDAVGLEAGGADVFAAGPAFQHDFHTLKIGLKTAERGPMGMADVSASSWAFSANRTFAGFAAI